MYISCTSICYRNSSDHMKTKRKKSVEGMITLLSLDYLSERVIITSVYTNVCAYHFLKPDFPFKSNDYCSKVTLLIFCPNLLCTYATCSDWCQHIASLHRNLYFSLNLFHMYLSIPFYCLSLVRF